ENPVSIKNQILSNEEINNTKFSDCTKFKTKNTSIENSSKDESHPALPSECNNSNSVNQEKDRLDTGELSSDLKEAEEIGDKQKAVRKGNSSADVENKINQNIGTTLDVESVPKPKLKVSKVTKQKREKKAPWKDEGQFKQFYRELIQALPIVANSHSPQGLAQTIIRQLRSGIPHSYWDDFIAGLPIGTSSKPEWEIEPGVPYPMFVEYLTEKLRAGNNSNSDEQTRNEVFRILNQPRQAKAFWGQFKRSVVNVAKTVERDRTLGVTNPNTPVWTRERVEPSIEEAKIAGEKIMAIEAVTTLNETSDHLPSKQKDRSSDSQCLKSSPDKDKKILDPWTNRETEPTETEKPSLRELLTQKLGNRNLKGFVKAIPKVSKSEIEVKKRQAMQPKNSISQMSIVEINNYLSDPILRKQIMPQLWHSSYQLIMDELGEIIAVKPPLKGSET
ncbi:MAG TPA: hypothetical protein ACFCUY_13765, partial [Xenococcaceae cyanobacterium]